MDKINSTKFQDDDSMNFDDNYNEDEFLKQSNATKKVQKLSIMDDFNQICHKFQHNKVDSNDDKEEDNQNTLTKYYAKCKQKTAIQPDLAHNSEKDSHKNVKATQPAKNNKSSPLQNIHYRSSSDTSNIGNQQLQNLKSSQTHQRHPSVGQNIKKSQQQENESKRNYSSVEDKKKILQPSKNLPNSQNNVAIKDYFGQQNTFVNRKVNHKNFINKKDSRGSKQQLHIQQKVVTQKVERTSGVGIPKNTTKVKNENNQKESNVTVSMKRSEGLEISKQEKNVQKVQRPRIIMYKKKIDLTQSTEAIIEAFKNEQMKSDYEMFSQSQSTIQEGLFAKAIVHQRAAKTVQNVQSPNYNYLQPTHKQPTVTQKQYISSPINITYSPNPSNVYGSIFQKRQNYIR